MTQTETWPSQWLRGALPLCVLAIVRREALHGYGIVTALADAGLGTITGGTLYPMLARLERDGLVTAQWIAGDGGPGRKVYRITAAGEQSLEADGARWARFATTTTTAIGIAPTPRGGTS